MASRAKRLAANAPGELFVDSTCIDCDTCRWMDPGHFDRRGEQSFVARQPQGEAEWQATLQALVSCPTASIGTETKQGLAAVHAAFPLPVEDEVFHCGYHHEASFGATSYLIRRPPERGGNVLVDSPRFAGPLVRRLEELGGVATMFLTHVDDVADHARFRSHFGCERVLHAADAQGELRGLERLLDGDAPVSLAPDLVAIPTPGHTRGSTSLLYRDAFLFTGDHAAWSEDRGHVYAFRSACWFDWDVQTRSMERLAAHRFHWILPGHGRRCRIPAERMPAEIRRAAAWMAAVARRPR